MPSERKGDGLPWFDQMAKAAPMTEMPTMILNESLGNLFPLESRKQIMGAAMSVCLLNIDKRKARGANFALLSYQR